MRKWVHDFLRERLLNRAGLFPELPKIDYETLVKEIYETTWDEKFFELMFNRLLMGRLRYGTKRSSKVRYNYTKSVADKIREYERTGNTELLVDIGNYCMLEFRHGQHPTKHFSATDDAGHCQIIDGNPLS